MKLGVSSLSITSHFSVADFSPGTTSITDQKREKKREREIIQFTLFLLALRRVFLCQQSFWRGKFLACTSRNPEICRFVLDGTMAMIFLRKEWEYKDLADVSACACYGDTSWETNAFEVAPASTATRFRRTCCQLVSSLRDIPGIFPGSEYTYSGAGGVCRLARARRPSSLAESFTRFLALSHFRLPTLPSRVAVSTPLSERDDYDDTDSISTTHCRAKKSAFEPQTVYFSMEHKIDSPHIRRTFSSNLGSQSDE